MRIEEGARLSQAILDCANHNLTRVDFLREVSAVLLEYCGCDAVEIRLNEEDLHYRWEATQQPRSGVRFELVRWTAGEDGGVIPALKDNTDLERLCTDVACQRFDSTLPFFTRQGSFWIDDTWEPFFAAEKLCVGGHYRSLVVTRFMVDWQTVGLLHIKTERPGSYTEEEVEFCEEVAQALGLAVAGWRAQAALRERIKELTCLYGIAQVVEQDGISPEEILQRVVKLLPPGWQFPENAAARIILDGRSFCTPGFRPTEFIQSADIVVRGRRRGAVEVVYLEDRQELASGVFLKEEEKLIAAVAREVALIVERKEAEEEKSKLHQQLIHADRLATIGQIAAGVAHELNEPLGSILGFAQLVQKSPELSDSAEQDIEKIITASLYAREVIRKLMVFARQMPARKSWVHLNQVVEEGLYFLEARCVRAGINLTRELSEDIPEISADPAQLKQVLVNLVVNAVQAMPDGGTLWVDTQVSGSSVVLGVKDTGDGISEEIRDKIFLPFFTTKDVDEGTGLGLAVVHGIVQAHGGSIKTESQSGQGTRFEVHLPVPGPADSEERSEDGSRQ